MHDRGTESSDRHRGNVKPGSDGETPALRLVRANRNESDRQASGIGPADLTSSAALSPALEDVVRRFGTYMRRTAHRHSIDAAELEDVVQETRIRLWRALGTTESIRQAPAAYIYRTTMSAALDFLRRRRARREESFDFAEAAGSGSLIARQSADGALIESDTRDAVTKAVGLLVESRRAVLKMYLAGYDREEIAELLGWSEAKVRNLLYRGLADVRQTLESWGYGPGAHS